MQTRIHKYILPFFFILLMISCGGDVQEVTLTEEEIDEYVAEKLDTSQVYDILQSLRFSKDNESYTVVEFSQNDTTILINEEIETPESYTVRNTYFMNGEPVFVEEYIDPLIDNGSFIERKVYIDGDIIIQAYIKQAKDDWDFEDMDYSKSEASVKDFDFQRSVDAVNQEGEYEMKYGEFLIIEPQRYLILENPVSKYNVALFILEGDMLLEELYNNPEKYEGKTIFVDHYFMTMNNINRMIYRGGIVKD